MDKIIQANKKIIKPASKIVTEFKLCVSLITY